MRICVFCGSSTGTDSIYSEAARELGEVLAARRIGLVYGGAKVGLMGAAADAALRAGGEVIGVIPQSLVDAEIRHAALTQCHIVASMHERKMKMAELADAFIALPGGIGTLEEIFEQWTWAKLGLHAKPCAFLNTSGYFGPLRRMIEKMVADGFLEPKYASMVVFDQSPGAIVEAFQTYSAPPAHWQTSISAREPKIIPVVAALVQDSSGRVLLVRKKGSKAFMQPGGKLQKSETEIAALERELSEELMCSVRPQNCVFLGRFTAPAANETGCLIEAALYRVEVVGTITPAAEIEEFIWLDPKAPFAIELAPLTRQFVLPLAGAQNAARQTA